MSFKDIEISQGSSQYFKFKPGESRLRAVSDPLPIWVLFDRENSTSLKCLTKDGAKKYLEPKTTQNNKIVNRFAVWVIDREDGLIKIAELPGTVIGGIKELANSKEFGFDGLPPYDFIVIRKGEGMDTTYTVTGARTNSELTEKEKEEILKLPSIRDMFIGDALDKSDIAPL